MKRYASYDYDSSNEEKTSSQITNDLTSSTNTSLNSSSSSSSASSSNQTMKRIKSTLNRIGNYIIGPKLNGLNYGSVMQYLCRKENSKDFFILKILNNDKNYEKTLQNQMLLHNEYNLLTLLQSEDGIIHHHGLFKEINCINGEKEKSEKLYLVLDCYLRHEYDNKHYFTNLQHYIIKQKYLDEREALSLLYKIFKIIENMHKKNIVHRDLKLGNIIYDLNSQRVYLINFCLGHQLIDETEQLNEQFGSPAYMSPDVLSNMPYYGKPNDIWSLGVILFTLLYGHLPFYDPIPERLFKKIQSAEFTIPNHIKVSDGTKLLIKNILQIDPLKRLTASEILDSIMSIFANHFFKSLSIDTRTVQQKMLDFSTNPNKKFKKSYLNNENDESKCQYNLELDLNNLTTNDSNDVQLKHLFL